jgi:hypothetical protein
MGTSEHRDVLHEKARDDEDPRKNLLLDNITLLLHVPFIPLL